jgi:hypothetical protein
MNVVKLFWMGSLRTNAVQPHSLENAVCMKTDRCVQGCATKDEVEAMSFTFPIIRALAASALQCFAELTYSSSLTFQTHGVFLFCGRNT